MRRGFLSTDQLLRGRGAGITLRAADLANQAALRNYRLFLRAAKYVSRQVCKSIKASHASGWSVESSN